MFITPHTAWPNGKIEMNERCKLRGPESRAERSCFEFCIRKACDEHATQNENCENRPAEWIRSCDASVRCCLDDLVSQFKRFRLAYVRKCVKKSSSLIAHIHSGHPLTKIPLSSDFVNVFPQKIFSSIIRLVDARSENDTNGFETWIRFYLYRSFSWAHSSHSALLCIASKHNPIKLSHMQMNRSIRLCFIQTGARYRCVSITWTSYVCCRSQSHVHVSNGAVNNVSVRLLFRLFGFDRVARYYRCCCWWTIGAAWLIYVESVRTFRCEVARSQQSNDIATLRVASHTGPWTRRHGMAWMKLTQIN